MIITRQGISLMQLSVQVFSYKIVSHVDIFDSFIIIIIIIILCVIKSGSLVMHIPQQILSLMIK
jgi:hypothetical protein